MLASQQARCVSWRDTRELTEWIVKNPAEAQRMAREELSEEMRTKFSPELVAKAWDRIVVTGEVTLDFFQEICGERAIRRLPPRRAGYFKSCCQSMTNNAEPRPSPPAELVVEGIDKWFRTNRGQRRA